MTGVQTCALPILKVQEAVLRNHEKYAGCTVHYVDEGIDTGIFSAVDRKSVV